MVITKRRIIGFATVTCIAVATLMAHYCIRPPNPLPGTYGAPEGSRIPASQANGPALDFCSNAYEMICQKTGATHDPTGFVFPDSDGEVQALRIYESIIREHPDWDSDQVDKELVNAIYTPVRRDRIESAYRWVLKEMEKFIERQPASVFTAGEKKLLKKRLKKTELQLPPPVALYADEPDLFTKSDVYYERSFDGKTRMRVGGAYLLSSKSWFNIVFTVAHEFAHAIDPCETRSARLSFPAYDRLGACFLQTGLIAARKIRSECGENDQLSETFADWMAVHITVEALTHFSTEFHGKHLVEAAINSVRDLCEQEESTHELDMEFHPPPKIRIQEIFGKNPQIRQLFACSPIVQQKYCDFYWDVEQNVGTVRTENKGIGQ